MLRNYVINSNIYTKKSIAESQDRQTVESVRFICNLQLCSNQKQILFSYTFLGCNITIIDPVLPYGLTHATERSDLR